MKISRALRTVLLGASLVGAVAFALDGELAALVAKAEKGNAIAQYNLGLAYAEGRGVPVDNLEAYVWLSLAIENGARGRALDTVVSRLSPAELDEAKTRLAQHRVALGMAPAAAAAPAETPAAPAETPAAPADAAADQELAQARADKQQLSTELAAAWKEADQLKAEVERLRAAAAAPAPDTEQLRRERDALAAKITELAGDVAALRTDRERLQKLAAQMQKDVSDARELNRAYQEQSRTSENRVAELVRQTEELKAQLGRANESIAALQSPRQPAENPELALKTRQLQSATTQLDEQRAANAELRDALAKADQDRASLQQMLSQAQKAAISLTEQNEALRAQPAPTSAPAYPDLRERVNDLEAQFAALRDAGPAFPDLRGRVAELEQQLAAASARPDAPAYPDLRDRVTELERQLAVTQGPAEPAYPDLRARTAQLESELAQATQRATTAEADAANLNSARRFSEAELLSLRSQLGRAQSAAEDRAKERDAHLAARTQLESALAEAQRAAQTPAAPAYPDLRERIGELEAQVAALRDAAPAYPDLRGRVAELEQQLATRPSAPSYPDLSAQVTALERDLAAARASAPAYPDLRERVGELERQLAAARNARPAAPAYPDLRNEVSRLERDLASAREAAPAYPDLRGRVNELEQQLAAASRAPSASGELTARVQQLESALATTQAQLERAQAAAPAGASDTANPDELTQRLTETEGKLATALRGYSLLQKEHDALQARLDKSSGELAAERDGLVAKLAAAEETARNAQAEAARLGESLAALQRGSSQAGTELTTARALVAQLQGANAVLARENYDLKAALSRDPSRGGLATPASPVAAGRTHTVAAGDSLSRISERYYGTPSRWPEILAANRDVLDAKATLRVGMTLRVP